MPLISVGVGAGLGALGGMLKKGPDIKFSAEGQAGVKASAGALSAYQNLTNKGPGEQDVMASLGASRDYANTLQNIASSNQGMYDMQRGNMLAAQQFGGQRNAMNQAFQDQMMQANRAASSAGRSSNDPILRARLAQDQTRQMAQMQADQSAAAMNLGRQSTTDMLSLQGSRVNTLAGLSQQAFGNQQNVFGMGQQLSQSEWSRALGKASYEQSQGGGFLGGLTGAMGGAAAGLNMAQGMGQMSNQSKLIGQMGQQNGLQVMSASANTLAAANGIGSMAGMSGRSPAAVQNLAPQTPAYQNPSQSIFSMYPPPQAAPQAAPSAGFFGGLSSLFGSSGGQAYNMGFSQSTLGR